MRAMTFARRPEGGAPAVLASLLLAFGEMAPAQPPAPSSVVTAVRFPRSVECGSAFEASLTFANDGDVPWRSGEVALGAVGDAGPFTQELRVALPAGEQVALGESHTFELRLAAPEIALPAAVSDWRLVTKDGAWFGGTASVGVRVTCPARIDDAEVLSAELPTDVSCGGTYEGSITVRNSGTTTWSGRDGYALEEVAEGDPVFAPRRLPLPERETVAPAAQRSFVVRLRAPCADGSFRTEWRMSRRGVGAFGASVTQWVRVRCPTPAASGPPL
jgi:hypothetical protein